MVCLFNVCVWWPGEPGDLCLRAEAAPRFGIHLVIKHPDPAALVQQQARGEGSGLEPGCSALPGCQSPAQPL